MPVCSGTRPIPLGLTRMKKKSPPGKSSRPGAATSAKKAPAATAAAENSADDSAAAAGETGSAPKQTMKVPEVLVELENAAKALSVRLTYEAIGGELGAGGLCKVKGQWRVIIDKRTTPSERVSVLAPALARFDFPSLGLSPQVHELLCRVAPTAESKAAADKDAAAAAAPTAAAIAGGDFEQNGAAEEADDGEAAMAGVQSRTRDPAAAAAP